MVLSEEVISAIKQVIMKELYKKITTLARSEDMYSSFYFKLFSPRLAVTTSVLQSIFTWFGGKWEIFAEIIARENFQAAKRHFNIRGGITDDELKVIDSIIKNLDSRKRSPDISKERLEIAEVLRVSRESKNMKRVSRIIDLFLRDYEDREFYIELKTVKPNKSESMEAKRKLLEIIAMRQKVINHNKIQVYLAMPFNPYGEERAYTRWTVTQFFKEKDDLLVGKDFWDFIGGPGTYEDLLHIFSEIGQELNELTESVIENFCKSYED